MPQLNRESVTTLEVLEALRNNHRNQFQREVFKEVPVRVEYSLTALGKSLLPVLIPLMQWSENHLKEIEAAQRRFDEVQNDLALQSDSISLLIQ